MPLDLPTLQQNEGPNAQSRAAFAFSSTGKRGSCTTTVSFPSSRDPAFADRVLALRADAVLQTDSRRIPASVTVRATQMGLRRSTSFVLPRPKSTTSIFRQLRKRLQRLFHETRDLQHFQIQSKLSALTFHIWRGVPSHLTSHRLESAFLIVW